MVFKNHKLHTWKARSFTISKNYKTKIFFWQITHILSKISSHNAKSQTNLSCTNIFSSQISQKYLRLLLISSDSCIVQKANTSLLSRRHLSLKKSAAVCVWIIINYVTDNLLQTDHTQTISTNVSDSKHQWVNRTTNYYWCDNVTTKQNFEHKFI